VSIHDRSCGACNACCVVLNIEEPLFKKAGVPCENLIQIGGVNGCGIYAERPPVCSTFRCLWLGPEPVDAMPRHLLLRDDERPDVCGLLIGPTSLKSNFFKATGIMLIAAYEVRPGGASGYHAQRLLKRISRRSLIAILPFDAPDQEPRRFIGPLPLLKAASDFATSTGRLRATIKDGILDT